MNPFDVEIRSADEAVQILLRTYLEFGGQYKGGEVHQTALFDILDFVNFRMETAESCVILAKTGRVADALGLARSLLENCILLKLMCRGTLAFKLQDCSALTEGQFKNKLRETQAENEAARARGDDAWQEVRSYRRAKRHIMYVFEGLRSEDGPEWLLPLHYFQFREFRPSTMRLKPEKYFAYYEPPPGLADAQAKNQADAAYRYKHYLSYDAMMECLALNGLASAAEQARLEAHYTFLGNFLHPTHDAARRLHAQPNVHHSGPAIGMSAPYAQQAVLLALVYVVHILADLLDDIAQLFEEAPSTYIAEPGTQGLRSAARGARDRFNYFWFVYNEAPLYDKWLHAIHHVTDEELAAYGGVAGVPSEMVASHAEIYDHFGRALSSWGNSRCGDYRGPLQAHVAE